MSSSEIDPEMTVIKSRVTVNQTEVTGTKSQLESEFKELSADFGKVSKVALKGTLNSLGGFRTFILRGNVVDLAIGIVIGAAFTSVVTAIVSDIITPLIPAPGGSLSNLHWILYNNPKSILDLGAFINAVISFLIVAAVLYFFVVQPMNRFMKLYKPKEIETPHETHECPYCFQAVSIKATRCPFCTSQLTTSSEKPEENEPVLILPASLENLSEQLAEKIVRKATTKLEKMATASEAGTLAKE